MNANTDRDSDTYRFTHTTDEAFGCCDVPSSRFFSGPWTSHGLKNRSVKWAILFAIIAVVVMLLLSKTDKQMTMAETMIEAVKWHHRDPTAGVCEYWRYDKGNVQCTDADGKPLFFVNVP